MRILRKFGERVRSLREKRKISLRRFAEKVGMSPTYLSKVERDEFPPPSEEKVCAIAKALGQDPDDLLALAGRVASDLPEIIQRHPREFAALLRTVCGLGVNEIERLTREAEKLNKSSRCGGFIPKEEAHGL